MSTLNDARLPSLSDKLEAAAESEKKVEKKVEVKSKKAKKDE